jgi:hypothetical protein
VSVFETPEHEQLCGADSGTRLRFLRGQTERPQEAADGI